MTEKKKNLKLRSPDSFKCPLLCNHKYHQTQTLLTHALMEKGGNDRQQKKNLYWQNDRTSKKNRAKKKANV